jgi:hypothetical protein
VQKGLSIARKGELLDLVHIVAEAETRRNSPGYLTTGEGGKIHRVQACQRSLSVFRKGSTGCYWQRQNTEGKLDQ